MAKDTDDWRRQARASRAFLHLHPSLCSPYYDMRWNAHNRDAFVMRKCASLRKIRCGSCGYIRRVCWRLSAGHGLPIELYRATFFPERITKI